MNPIAEDILMHYGVKRRSGRYPWGSGENPYQHGGDFLARVEELEAMGKSQKEIAEELKMSTTDLRMQVRVAKHERRALQAERAKSLREEGKTLDEIAKIMGYQKGKRKQLSGNMNVITRTTDPQTVYRTDALHRDDIIDITDFDVVEYQYAVMRENINEDVATAIMVGDGREPDDEMKISEDHIRSIWNDNDLYTIHYDVDIEAAKAELQGSKTSMSFGENYIYAEAVIAAALYAREKYKGTGTPDFFCTPHMVNVMLLARDMNGRRIYTSKADLAAALNVGELYTAEQFEGLVRMDDEGHKHKLLGIFVNLTDYTVGSTKGGEITRFDQFDIDFNQQKYLIETRLSGALTRVYSAIALEEPVAAFASGGTGGDGGGAGTP